MPNTPSNYQIACDAFQEQLLSDSYSGEALVVTLEAVASCAFAEHSAKNDQAGFANRLYDIARFAEQGAHKAVANADDVSFTKLESTAWGLRNTAVLFAPAPDTSSAPADEVPTAVSTAVPAKQHMVGAKG